MWTCANGHSVRDGMFACGRCGTDRIAAPDDEATVADEATASREGLRVAARKEISDRLGQGVGLALVGLLAQGLALGAGADGDQGPVALVLALVGYTLILVGAGLVLVAVVGHGVRLGVESARVDQGARADRAGD